MAHQVKDIYNRKTQGNAAEQYACEYLQQQGLHFKQRNYACRLGEIDLIMMDKEFLVFVEVRYRKGCDYGGAEASVSKHKQAKIIKTARYYLMLTNQYDTIPCRFDVIAMRNNIDKPEITWIQNAFST
ncbi:MAG: YraN family protein [Gammaproteobacteria bacterium]